MHVVFLRAANVGGKNVFRPTALVAALKHLDVVNVGAAGTFVIRKKVSLAAARSAVVEQLGFETTIVIRPAHEIVALVESDPFHGVRFSKDLRGWIAALDRAPLKKPVLPAYTLGEADWGLRLDRIDRQFAMGLWKRRPSGVMTSSNFIEKLLGASATVRWWETFQRIARVIDA